MKKVTYDPFESGPLVKAVPSTEAQREIWASIVMDGQATLCYNESLAIDFDGNLRHDILNLAYQELIKKHDALRAAFSSDGKTFFVKAYQETPIKFLDYTGRSRSELEVLKRAEVQFKYDLVRGPCYRATLVKTSSSSYTLLFSAHHIVCDGWSLAILLTELSQFYVALCKGQRILLEATPQFADFAVYEYRNGLNSQHKSYWLNEFKTPLKTNNFPIDYKRPSFRTFNSARYDMVIPVDTVRGMKKLGNSQGCSFYSTLISAFNLLLFKLSKSEDIVVGMASASQPALEQNELIGHMVNLLPLRTTIKENTPFNQYMKSTRSKMLDAFDHQFYSYGPLVKDLSLKRDPSQMPLLNVVFNIDQQAPDQGLKFEDVKASYTTIAREYDNFEIFINAVSTGDKLILECQYNTNLFSLATIENWLSSYIDLMNLVIQNSTKGILDFNLPNLKIPADKTEEVSEKKAEKVTKRHPEIEDKIKRIWTQVLLDNAITVDDNFFAIGGHSLLAIEVAALLEGEFQTPINIRHIFEYPTILELGQYIAGTLEKSREVLLPKITPTGLTTFPVSHNQKQIWYIEELDSHTTMHNLPASIRVKSALDVKVLEKTIQFLMNRHPSLRTAIVSENGVLNQKVYDSHLVSHFKLELLHAKEENIHALLDKESKYVFNKEEAPMFRAKLYQLGHEDFVFYFMIHHAIWDGWSFDIFFEELNVVYSALIRGENPVFEKNPEVSYIDYTSWLNNHIVQDKISSQLSFWENKLRGTLPVLELPLDYKRPLVANNHGKSIFFTLTADQSAKLRRYAKEQNSSLFNVFLTAFKVTLARYVDQESDIKDIIVGIPVRGRPSDEVMQTIGYFVNTLTLRSALHLGHSFEENLKAVTQTALEAFDNQLAPFQMVLNKVAPIRENGHPGLFQTFFSYQDVSNRGAMLNNTAYTQINIDKEGVHTDLDLWIKASDKKIEGGFEYRVDLFKKETIERFEECFFHVLNALFDNKGTALKNLSPIPRHQETLILREWNNTASDMSSFVPFHKLFMENARITPEKVAIETSQGQMTYGELDKLSTRCANKLMELGVGRGDLVGISLTRDFHLLIAIFGALKAGAGYVPLDPAFPQERLDYMIESARPKALLSEESLAPRFLNTKVHLISDFINNSALDYELKDVKSSLNDTAYVIYTSGSTGKPKGVELGHLSVINFLLAMRNKNLMAPHDKLLAVTTLSFDIAVLELYLPLISGGSVYLATSSEAMDGQVLKKILETKKISVMQATPSTWRLLLASGWKGDKSLKILCGGEAFPIDLAKTLTPICLEVWNMYGPTETTVWSSCKRLLPTDEVITIGSGIDNTTLYVLDENHKHRPIGASGELFIGGIGLAKGYFGRSDLTEERFVADPFIPGAKMYATGDLARFRANGEVECLGRNDGQVKVRGYRIELGEIEAQIAKLDGVLEAAAITSEYRAGDMRIVAYIKSKQTLEERKLREQLVKVLPAYMIPSHFIAIDDLPKTLNGKIDKKTLTKMNAAKIASGNTVVEVTPSEKTEPAQTLKRNLETEKVIKDVWSKILHKNDISVEDNFFAIGGHSFYVIEVVFQLKNLLKRPVSIKDINDYPTIMTLASHLEKAAATSEVHLPVIAKSDLNSFSVSRNQLQIWFLEGVNKSTIMHNLPAAMRVKSKLDKNALEKTIHCLIARHPSFRTVLKMESGMLVQKVLGENEAMFKPRLEVVKAREDEAINQIKKDAKVLFNISEAPLFKAKLYELGHDDYIFSFVVHHAIWDGWSFEIFFEELNTAYSALVKGEVPCFNKDPENTYIDYTVWLENLIASGGLNHEVNFWKEKLSLPLPVLELPVDFKRPLVASHNGASIPFTLSGERAKLVRDYARNHQTSVFNVMLTAFKTTIARYMDQEDGASDVIVGIPVRGRHHEQVMQTIGYFVNTLALRSVIDHSKSFEENLKIVSKNTTESLDHQLVPFQVILNQMPQIKDASRSPVFQTFFSYKDITERVPLLNGSPYSFVEIDRASTHTDLDLWINAGTDKIEGGFEYRIDLFKQETIERFADCFFHVLDGLFKNQNIPLKHVDSIPAKQQELILKDWNNTASDMSTFVPFHKLFMENAKRNPEKVAIETSKGQMTYRELDKLSTRCANKLIESGVKRGDLVGISLTRDFHLLIAIFGALKAGAGYVPLDPAFPQERLDYMIESSNPKALITESSLASRFLIKQNLLTLEFITDPKYDYELKDVGSSLEDTAYVIYTSGSTGKPKGVELGHLSVINFLLGMKHKNLMKNDDKLLAVTTLSFDIAVLELYLPLISGGSIYLATSSEAMDGQVLKKILETKKISVMQATPSTWRLLLASGWKGDKSLKILCGGEAFPIDLAKTLTPICLEVWNMYGPTETTVWSSCKRLLPTDEVITIGSGIDNTTLYVLDENHKHRPIGASGELFIGGIGLAKGYFGRSDLTEERFVADPFIPGAKMYATGDLARFRANGEVECLGRNDGQVKVRGYRIELGEIEAQIAKLDGVLEAAAITSEYRAGDVRIVAYIKSKQTLEERKLREQLVKVLPAYMIPSHFIAIDDLPKTLNGKIDKKTLTKMNAAKIAENAPVEMQPLAQIKVSEVASIQDEFDTFMKKTWMDVLGISDLKASDNFFDVGGNSLLAVQMYAKISEKYNLDLPLALLIEASSFQSFKTVVYSKIEKTSVPVYEAAANVMPQTLQIYKSLVIIKASGKKNPFFCFHGVGGNVLNYITLMPAAKNDRPLMALQSVGLLNANDLPLQTVEEMARAYVREIRLIQPEGPYLLAGGSMGGMVAFEAAIQLMDAGEKIEKLIMFDTFGPNLDLQNYVAKDERTFLEKVKSALLIKSKNFFLNSQIAVCRFFGKLPPLPALLHEIESTNYKALWKYYPKKRYEGDIDLIRANVENVGWYSDPLLGWDGIVKGEIRTYEISASHEKFIESPELIAVLKKLI
ncbi:non-ribosomal peptide synthetase [Bacteriovorax stolpii]|uniref:non-ribosomal peptide synthetase n=1 Tax=Bacteriovorax stolpii TaxID=960 RepID=UPI00115A3B70|nr:non-ribosomal peptide synthetase [Bacteriovorax stolpii]